MAKIETKTIAKNISLSMIAQLVSLIVAFVLNLVVPKLVDEYQYAYWQTYVLYRNYVGVLHFGLLDGLVLRYSQYDYEEIEKPRIRSQFMLMLVVNTMFALIVASISCCLIEGAMLIVAVYVAVMIIVNNIFNYTSYTFQITNRIVLYARFVILQKVVYGLGVVVALVFGLTQFYWICLMEAASEVVSVILLSRHNCGMYLGSMLPARECITEAKENVSAGILLMIANWSSMLLIGSVKMLTQWRWGDLVFGKVSFAFSVTSLFLTFITAISVVLFPVLKRMNQEQLPSLYEQIRNALSPLLLAALLLYFPGCFVLELWLPTYQSSLFYLGLLLPMIVYTSKITLLTNNYLKAYRKEKLMLIINVVCILVTIVLCSFCAYMLDNLELMLLCLVLVVIARSIISEVVVMKLINRKNYKDFFIEIAVVTSFIVCAMCLPRTGGFCAYALLVIGYCVLKKDTFVGFLKMLRY